MLGTKKVICVIPARLKSTRFPKKMIADLSGKPLLQWVWEAAMQVSFFDEVVIATDAEEIAECIAGFGGRFVFTSPSCQSGTERLIELEKSGGSQADIWVNWQGDEPFIQEAMIVDLLQTSQHEESDVWTLCKKITVPSEINNPHIAKLVCDKEGYARYFSRSPIPYYRDPIAEELKLYYKHVGLYAYTKQALQKMRTLEGCYLEEAEQLEQLRFLYHGLRVRVHETQHDVFGIDLPEHLVKAEERLALNV